jgi:PIN domain nuclease of toxin-antitoxin system
LPLPQGSLTEQLEAQGFSLLPILPRHVEAARRLTCAHADPFDRLLIAQASDERLTLLTRDTAILGLELEGLEKG